MLDLILGMSMSEIEQIIDSKYRFKSLDYEIEQIIDSKYRFKSLDYRDSDCPHI